MTHSEIVPQSKIDAHLDQVLSDADERRVRLAHEIVAEPDDRWYRQLAVNVYASLTDTPDVDTVLPAATAIELLCGYVRLRNFIEMVQEYLAYERKHQNRTPVQHQLQLRARKLRRADWGILAPVTI